MPNRCILAALLAGTLLLGGCAKKLPTQLFTSEDGGFSVQTPVPLEESERAQPAIMPGTTLREHSYTGIYHEQATFQVSYVEMPYEDLQNFGPDKILAMARDGPMEVDKGTLIRSTPMTVEGRPGLDFEYYSYSSSMRLQMHHRLVLDGTRLYRVLFQISEEGQIPPGAADAFIASFHILKPNS